MKLNYNSILHEIDSENFYSYCQRLNLIPSELQMGLVLFHPELESTSEYLLKAPEISDFDDFLKFKPRNIWSQFEYEFQSLKIDSHEEDQEALKTVKCTSETSIFPSWPFQDKNLFEKQIRARKQSLDVKSESLNFPTIVY